MNEECLTHLEFGDERLLPLRVVLGLRLEAPCDGTQTSLTEIHLYPVSVLGI